MERGKNLINYTQNRHRCP